MRVFIYLRVSTDDQEDHTGLEQQEIDCRDYCEEHAHKVMGVFRDVYTGSVWRERENFMKMRARYLAGDADAVVVRTYSRFTRMIADYYVMTQEMREHNVKLLCVKEQYDATPLGHMLQAIQMGFNEKELAAIQSGKLSYERVMEEYRNFVDWCREFKKNGQENATYQQKREALRFLGVTVSIYKDGSPQGRYVIRLAPPQLRRSVTLLLRNIAEASSG